MSALDDCADIIKQERETVLCPTPTTVREELQYAIVRLADELEALQNDAKLGKLVRQMPDYTMLRQMKRGRWEYWDYVFDGDPTTVAYSPEAALEKALGEEQNERT